MIVTVRMCTAIVNVTIPGSSLLIIRAALGAGTLEESEVKVMIRSDE
jgi:hypothetical protein